jgi:hypothetical protein
MPTIADEMFRIRPRRIISWGIDNPDSIKPTTRSVP